MSDGTETGNQMSEDNRLTTGEELGMFYRELTNSGVPEDVAGRIVFDAAANITRDYGFSIHKETANV